MLTPDEVHRELLERGCELRRGASPADIEMLQRALGSDIAPYVREIYTRFDGFVENTADHLSNICVWSINEMLHFRVDRKMVTEIAAFGDLLVHSDFLSCALSTSDSPVVLLESQEELSASFEMFWFKFLNSEYDICG